MRQQKSTKLQRLKSLTNSMRFKSSNATTNQSSTNNNNSNATNGLAQTQTTTTTTTATETTPMPTIFEANNRRWSAMANGANKNTNVRQIINTISNAPHRFSQNLGKSDEENLNLTQNILD